MAKNRKKRKEAASRKKEASQFLKIVLIGTLILMVLAYLSYRGA